MAGNENQKRKLLELAKLFYYKTDENNRIGMEDILKHLDELGVKAERKGIYRDIEHLKEAGMDIYRESGYYLASRAFELAELKLLADAVAASGSISAQMSVKLIKKLQGLASVHQAQELNRSVFVSGRVKTENEALIYNVDILHQGINAGKKISFVYYEYAPDKSLKPRRNGERYVVSPYLMCWDNQHYYLVAYHKRYEGLAHFRVDKMKDITLLKENVVKHGDISSYAAKTFGMFAGEPQKVEIEIPKEKLGVVIDRFGKDIFISNGKEGFLRVFINVAVSPVFYSWVFMLGKSRILYPENAAAEYQNMLKDALLFNKET